ncbi:MAG: OmpA family protein [Bacteroidetes bacterium]|nr:OmpA family protein [Bacteroidota bacterium]
MSIISEDGSWQPSVNLGSGINTAQNELSPFYHPLGKVLFFSSNGHKGYGGFDVFVTSFPFETDSPASINLGLPFNSFKDDLYLSLDEHKGYLSSNRENADGNFDIYTFNVTTSEAVLLSLQNEVNTTVYLDSTGIIQFFSKQDRLYFQQLPLEDKVKVKNFIRQQSFRNALAEKSVLSESESFFYESLAAEEKNIIERLSDSKKDFLLKKNQDVSLAEDQFYYQNLPLEKKEKIKQIIEKRAFDKILQDESLTDPQLTLFYESLPLEDRHRIDRAIEERKDFVAKSFQDQDSPTLEDIFFYQMLPSEQKEKVERMIAAKVFQKENTDHSSVHYEPLMDYEELPLQEKQRINRLVNARRFAAKAAEDDVSPEISFEKDYFDIGLLTFNNPENITIEGRLLANEKPANAVKVSLVSGSKHKEKVAITNQEGEFSFSGVNYHKDQKILFDQEAGFMQLTKFKLEELRVIVLQDTIIQETFDNIYFETDQYTISDSSKVILDKLASFHFKHPDVKIEISGYADTTGGEPYNKQLSYKRASEAYQYLTSKGVNQDVINILPKGKDIPRQGKDLKYSRRIEFALHAISASYNPTREIFIISPNPDLKEIASRYKLSLSDLLEMNQKIDGEPAPFTPIRVLSRRK